MDTGIIRSPRHLIRLDGIHKGFRIGFDRSLSLVSAGSNLHCNNPNIVSDYLAREVALHRMWKCPMGIMPKSVHISLLGLIPKKNEYNMEIHISDEVVQRLYRAGLSAASHRTYQVAQ